MRVTDDRYRRDRSRLELALRLVKHEARTQTIRQWTGLSDDRVRKLIRSYIRPGAAIRRHRGKSPQQVGFFLRTAQLDHDTHVLAAMLVLFGVLPTRQRGQHHVAPRRSNKDDCSVMPSTLIRVSSKVLESTSNEPLFSPTH